MKIYVKILKPHSFRNAPPSLISIIIKNKEKKKVKNK